MKKHKIYTCKHCKKKNEEIGVFQVESHCYSFDLNTKQLEDLHGSETTEKQLYFCLNCNNKISKKDSDILVE